MLHLKKSIVTIKLWSLQEVDNIVWLHIGKHIVSPAAQMKRYFNWAKMPRLVWLLCEQDEVILWIAEKVGITAEVVGCYLPGSVQLIVNLEELEWSYLQHV